MTKTKRRILSFLCALCLLLGDCAGPLGQLTLLRANGEGAGGTAVSDMDELITALNGTQDGDKITLQPQSGGTVILERDISCAGPLTLAFWVENAELTIDLGGHTLTVESPDGIVFSASSNANIILLNGTLASSISAASAGRVTLGSVLNVTGDASVTGSAVLYLDGGTLTGNVTLIGGSGLTVTGGKIEGNVTAESGPTVTVSDGEISGDVSVTNGTTTVSGGTIGGDLSVTNGTTKISDGEITGDVTAGDYTNVTITGGTFHGGVSAGNGASVTISGGEFENTPSGAGIDDQRSQTQTGLTVTFKNGDTVVREVEVEPGEPIGAANIPDGPEKDNCTFKGWYTESGTEPVTETSEFQTDTILYAKYSVTVSFSAEGADLPLPASVTIDEGASLEWPLPEVSRTGYRFDGWYLDQAFTAKAEEHTDFSENTTLYARFVKQITVTFMAEGGTIKTVEADEGGAIGELPDAPLDGATLEGWYVDGNRLTVDSAFDHDVTATARYTVTVTFHVKSKNYTTKVFSVPVVIMKGTAIGSGLPGDPALAGYEFNGWFLADDDGKPDDTEVTGTTEFSKHTDVVAKFTRQVTLTFKYGDVRQAFTVDQGETVDLLENPIESGSRFDGWYDGDKRITNSEGITDTDGNLIDLAGNPLGDGADPVRRLVVNDNMTLTARFIRQITVQFLIVHPVNKSSAGTPSVDSHKVATIDKGGRVDPFPSDPLLSQYEFQGWYQIKQYEGYTKYSNIPDPDAVGAFVLDKNWDGVPYVLDETKPVTAGYQFDDDTVVAAKFARKVNVIFQYDTGSGTTGNQTVECVVGTPLSGYAPAEEAERDGYRLQWYRDDDTPVGDADPVTVDDDNKVIRARYIKQVTLTFENEGVQYTIIMEDEGTSVSESGKTWPDSPTPPEGTRFIGWYDEDGKQYDANTIITENVLLRAVFAYTATFKAHREDGTEDETVLVRDVEKNTELGWFPASPFWEGHRFKEWRVGDEVISEAYRVTADVTVIGYFDPVDIYTITVRYFVDGETDPTDTRIVAVDRGAVSAENPAKIDSPPSFEKSNGRFFPVMQSLWIIPGEKEGEPLVIQDKHEDVDVVYGADKTITVTVPYKVPTAAYSVRYMLLNLDGAAGNYDNSNYTQIDETTEDENKAVLGAVISPAVKEYPYAELNKVEPGIVAHESGDVFYVYYTRRSFKLTYETYGGKALNSVTELYGTPIPLVTPERAGYTFTGWYKDAERTQRVENTITLTDNITLHAGWQAQNVDYTVVFMVEKYNDAGTAASYQYDSSYSYKGEVGAEISASDVTAPGTFLEKHTYWEPDTAKNSTSSVTVAAEGNSVLMVYYKLKEYTFYFRPGTYGTRPSYNVTATLNGDTKSGNNNFNFKMTVKLGQVISSSWPTSVTNAYYTTGGGWLGGGTMSVSFGGWNSPGGSVYVTKRLTVTTDMLPSSGSSVTYSAYWLTSSQTYTVNYWLQNADNDNYTRSEEYSQTYNYNSGGLTAKEISGYTYDHGDSGTTGITTFNFYYNRDTYEIDYYYGSRNLKTIENVKFDATITSTVYNWTPTAAQSGVEDDYIWEGWYADSGLTTPYVFDKMPSSNVVLYGKWTAPKYSVTFHLNYEGAEDPYFPPVTNVTKGLFLSTVISTLPEAEKADINDKISHPPARTEYTFAGWYTSPTGTATFDPSGTAITGETHVYAQWRPTEITSYRVQYLDENDGTKLLDTVTRLGRWELGTVVEEKAPYIAGYSGPDKNVIADAAVKTLRLSHNEADNVITFYYQKRPPFIEYTVRYVLFEDPNVRVAADAEKTVGGTYTSVTEIAAAPTVEAYKNYRPTEVTKTLELGYKKENNVLTFYYAKGARITVEYLDMEGDPIPGTAKTETYQDPGVAWRLDTLLPGYTLDHVEKNGDVTDGTSFTPASDTDTMEFRAYYKYNLTVIARSLYKSYSEEVLTDAGTYTGHEADERIRVDGLKNGHTVTGIRIDGMQANVGISPSTPSEIRVDGLKNELAPEDFYEIDYVSGSLLVTRINVVISLEPDRWTGNIYDGNVKLTGFTNGSKKVGDYILIYDETFKTAYLQRLWEVLFEKLRSDPSGDYVIVENSLQDSEGSNTVAGLAVIVGKKDAGDYYKDASVFETAFAGVLSNLAETNPEELKNYNIIHYVRESRLEIQPLPVSIETAGAWKNYDGKALTKQDGLVVKVNGETVSPTADADGELTQYTLVTGDDGTVDKVTIRATGSQTIPGESQNTYTIDWGKVNPNNYTLSETLGKLKVKPQGLIVEMQDINVAYGEDAPAYAVKVYQAEKDEDGSLKKDANGKLIKTEIEIPAALTHWNGSSYTLKLGDPESTDNLLTDNLSIQIRRYTLEDDEKTDEGKPFPGTYKITVDWAEEPENTEEPENPEDPEDSEEILDPKDNFVVDFLPGTMVVGIARVSNDGSTWTYHEYLVHDKVRDVVSTQGAFDRASGLTGDVIVETLCEPCLVPDGNGNDENRYRLADVYTFGETFQGSSLTLETWDELIQKGLYSTLTRNDANQYLLAWNVPDKTFTVKQIILDGKQEKGSAGLLHVTAGTLEIGKDAVVTKVNSTGNGAVYAEKTGEVNMIAGSVTGNNAANGGAIYAKDSAKITVSGGSVTGNTAVNEGNGGAVYAAGTAQITISGGSVTGNNAAIGGAVYAADTAQITISGGSVTENTAGYGAAVYTAGTAQLTVTGGSITGNTGTEENGGAINVESAGNKLYFGGKPEIYNNASDAEDNQKNVVLSVDSNEVIRTTAEGLVEGAKIGVYVIDGEKPEGEDKNYFDKHGRAGKPFGTFTNHENLNSFVNDRNTDLYGEYHQTDETDMLIYWIRSGSAVAFRKIDSFGEELAGAKFRLFTDPECTEPYKIAPGEYAEATSADGENTVNRNLDVLKKGTVLFEEIPDGVYYMKETYMQDGTPKSGAPEGFEENEFTYVVLIGEEVLTRPMIVVDMVWNTGGILADITQEMVKAQTDQYTEDKQDYKLTEDAQYAIFRIESGTDGTAKAVDTPDIAKYGILDVPEAARKVILKKIDITFTPLSGAEFEILRYDRTKVSQTDGSGESVTTFTSDGSGAYFIDMLPYGTYYLHETKSPAGTETNGDKGWWYTLTVDQDGVVCSVQADTEPQPKNPAADG